MLQADFSHSIIQDIEKAESISVLTGAGISAESGVATFRGKEGIWSKFRPEELANVSAFLANPERVWEWYQHRRNLLANVKPNPGHYALSKWETLVKHFTLATQNVDGLHQLAGSRNVLELHGNIRTNRCQLCGLESDAADVGFDGQVPLCGCGGMFRPGVVWFGEMLPEHVIQQAFLAAQTCDLFLTVGTSALVYPAASLPEIARESGATVVEVNIEETPFSGLATHHLRGKSGVILPQLVAAYESHHKLDSHSSEMES